MVPLIHGEGVHDACRGKTVEMRDSLVTEAWHLRRGDAPLFLTKGVRYPFIFRLLVQGNPLIHGEGGMQRPPK